MFDTVFKYAPLGYMQVIRRDVFILMPCCGDLRINQTGFGCFFLKVIGRPVFYHKLQEHKSASLRNQSKAQMALIWYGSAGGLCSAAERRADDL